MLSFVTAFLDEDHAIPGLLSFVVGLLWLKTLGFLKSVNLPLATFILSLVEVRFICLFNFECCFRQADQFRYDCISQILKDIRWFLVVLSVNIIMFADMLHISTTRTNNGLACKANETSDVAPEEFCGDNLIEPYFKLYSVVVGDVNYDDFNYSTGSKLLFILFTFVCVIILLNVLIAIVSNSHKRSSKKSWKLFGR